MCDDGPGCERDERHDAVGAPDRGCGTDHAERDGGHNPSGGTASQPDSPPASVTSVWVKPFRQRSSHTLARHRERLSKRCPNHRDDRRRGECARRQRRPSQAEADERQNGIRSAAPHAAANGTKYARARTLRRGRERASPPGEQAPGAASRGRQPRRQRAA